MLSPILTLDGTTSVGARVQFSRRLYNIRARSTSSDSTADSSGEYSRTFDRFLNA